MRTKRLSALHVTVLLFGLFLLPQAGIADETSSVDSPWQASERFAIEVGAMGVDYDTQIQDSNSTTTGTLIDLEDVLGLDNRSTDPYIKLYFRLGNRHRLDVTYYDLNRANNGTTTQNVVFGNLVIPAGTPVNTEFDYQVFDANYSFSVHQSHSSEFAIVAGLYVVGFDTRVVELTPGNSDEQHVTVPLPNIGVRFNRLLSQNWLLSGRINYFDISIDDVDGRYFAHSVALDYLATRRVSVGLGYNSVSLRGDKTDEADRISIDYDGWTLGGKIRF